MVETEGGELQGEGFVICLISRGPHCFAGGGSDAAASWVLQVLGGRRLQVYVLVCESISAPYRRFFLELVEVLDQQQKTLGSSASGRIGA